MGTICQIEIESILVRNEAIFSGEHDHHFCLPAGLHSDRFVRLADALRDRVDVLRISDWILPYLGQNNVVLADTGTLLPLLQALQQQASIFEQKLEFETLQEYPQQVSMIPPIIDELRAKANYDDKFLCLISVNASGTLIRTLHALAPSNSSILVICNTGDEIDGVVTLSNIEVSHWAVGNDGRCEQCVGSRRSHVIGIDPRTYERLPNFRYETVRIDRKTASKNSSFWQIADKMDAIRLHVTMPYTQSESRVRHHGIYLDIPRLLQHPKFLEKCVQKLRALCIPDLVLIPSNESTDALRSLVHQTYEQLGDNIIRVVEFGKFTKDIAGDLQKAANILIVDDAIVTGGVLLNLRRAVYAITKEVKDVNVFGFVVVARPPNKAIMQSVIRPYLSHEGSCLEYGEKVFLPRSGDQDCHWCQESSKLQIFLSSFGSHMSKGAMEYAERRKERLIPEIHPPFLFSLEDNAGEVKMVTRGSFFGSLRPIAAFAAMTSSCQERAQELKSSRHGSVIEVVDLKMAIDSYYDPVFIAAMLRTFEPPQLRCPEQDSHIEEVIGKCDPARVLPGMIAELGWAAVTGRIPPTQVLSLINHTEDEHPAHILMKELIEFMYFLA